MNANKQIHITNGRLVLPPVPPATAKFLDMVAEVVKTHVYEDEALNAGAALWICRSQVKPGPDFLDAKCFLAAWLFGNEDEKALVQEICSVPGVDFDECEKSARIGVFDED